LWPIPQFSLPQEFCDAKEIPTPFLKTPFEEANSWHPNLKGKNAQKKTE